jgi:integral membrane sensor domain MASE1
MLKKFHNLDFGLQMMIICLLLFFSNQLTSYTLSMANDSSTIQFNIFIILTFILFLIQTASIYIGIKSAINYVKQLKNKNTNDEQSN